MSDKRDELFQYLIDANCHHEGNYVEFKMLLLLIEDVMAERLEEDAWKRMVQNARGDAGVNFEQFDLKIVKPPQTDYII